MLKSILKCSIFVLLAIAMVACNRDDHRDFHGNGNVNCYHHNGNVNCHRN